MRKIVIGESTRVALQERVVQAVMRLQRYDPEPGSMYCQRRGDGDYLIRADVLNTVLAVFREKSGNIETGHLHPFDDA